MESPPKNDPDVQSRIRQQEVVAELGQTALETDDLDHLLREACAALVETLDTEYAGALELAPDGDRARLRHGVGWRDGVVGSATVPTGGDYRVGRVLRSEEPVIVTDLESEERFTGSELLTGHDVASGVSVVVGSVEDPWGVLGTHATEPREFTEHDAAFLTSVANVLASAVENYETRRQLTEERDMFAKGPTVIFRWRRAEGWPVEYVSDNVEDVLGYTPAELESGEVPYTELLLDEERDRIASEVEANNDETTDRFSHEPYRVRTRSGGVRWVKDTTKILREDGEITGYLGYLVDITERKEREVALERYRTIVEAVNDGVYVVDGDGRFTMVNEAYAEMTGYDRDDLVGEHVSLVVDERTSERAQDAEAQLRAGDADAATIEAELRTADGETFPAEANFATLPVSDDGQRRVGVVRDVSEREERRRELRRYEKLFTESTDVNAVLHPDGTFQYLPPSVRNVLGYEPDELVGENAFDNVHPEDRDRIAQEFQQMVDDPDYSPTEEFRYRHADGSWIWLEASGRNLLDDPDIRGLVAYTRDVTDRMERERELEEYRTFIGEVLDAIDDVFYVLDEDGELKRWNQTLNEVSGYTDEEIASMHARDFFPSDDEPSAAAAVRSAFETGSIDVELDLQMKDGETFPFEFVGVSLENPDGDPIVAGIGRNVTEQRERERDLREAKAQLEAATDAGEVSTWEWRVQADELFMSQSFATKFGVDPTEAREGVALERFLSAIHEADRDRVRRSIDAAVETCGEFEEEYRVRDGDGTLRWVVARGRVECDEDGEPVTFPGALTDITQRKRAEIDLQQTNDQMETLFDVLPVGVVVAETDGEIVHANDNAHEIWGGDVFDAESLADYGQYPVYAADTGERVPSAEMTLSRVLRGEEVTDPDLYELHTVDGQRRIVEAEGMPIRDQDGAVVRGVVTMSDVTERWEAQQNLEESERRYRTLVENFPSGAVGLFDEELEYTAVGGELMEATGVQPEDRIGNRVTDIYPDEIVEAVEPYFHAALDGEANSFEAEYHDRHLYAHTLPIRNAADEVFAGMLVVQDVTDRREYERKLEESNERLEQFAYAASHDLQEPLRMVSSYLQLVESRYADELDEDGEEFIEYAVDGADRMREMIEGLLEYSRIDTRGDPFDPVELEAVLADVQEDLQVKIEEQDADIAVGSLPRVRGDRNQIRQLFQNLLDNALEYSGDEPPRVDVEARRDGNWWIVSVEDEGIGIDSADVDQVFDVFERLHSQGDGGGTGIGLALCERIVERHGGDIWVDSAPGEGTTFSVAIPASPDGDE